MARNPKEVLSEKLREGVVSLASRATDSAVTAVSREIDARLNPTRTKQGLKPIPASARAAVDVEDEDADEEGQEDQYAEDGGEGGDDEGLLGLKLPLCFNIGTAEENLELAAAAWRILGKSEEDVEDPDIIAVYPDGRAYVGTLAQWQNYCEAADFDGDWDLWGIASQDKNSVQYNTEEIWTIKCSKKALNKVLQDCYNPEALAAAQKQHDGFHWHEGDDPTTIITEVPGVHGVLADLGAGDNLIYTARKGGEVAKYTHQFGEGAKVRPRVYALGPRTLVIHGGDMVIEDRGIVHN